MLTDICLAATETIKLDFSVVTFSVLDVVAAIAAAAFTVMVPLVLTTEQPPASWNYI